MKSIWLGLVVVWMLVAVTGTMGAAVMSIDLGSEWMKVGVVSPGVPMEIALNKESKRKTPAVLAFRDGNRIFGEDAQTIGLRFPDKSYFYVVDLLGKSINNPLVKLFQQRFPYYHIEADAVRDTIIFKSGEDAYSVEELVAQYIQKARDFAEDSTGQQITECVIVVPGFYGQAERRALLTAASLANIKVLQLINDYTAVALNYGIFRRNEINETAQYYMFYDMGASKTTATVVSYQTVKDKATRETNPVISILGVGYDRTLGGLEMQLRLRDYLAHEFNAMKKTPTDVFTSPRALAKLFKEAGRVKNVLSANANHYAQIEGLLDDKDFKFQVTRDVFEQLSKDLFDRAAGPLHKALATAGITLDVINQVILFGGGTRVPKIQEVLKAVIQQELGKNINMDEAAAMGAVYRAADLATGFKVKKIITKDATVFPIQVTFEREGDSGNVKLIKRSLFGPMNAYPQKKVITFNKHTEDFSFNVNYAELDHLSAEEVAYLGSLNLTKIKLSDVAKVLAANVLDENTESKGIKAHFVMDDSGVFDVSGVEYVLEKTVVETDDESPLSKLGSTISKLFSTDKDADEKVDEKPDEEPASTQTDAPLPDSQGSEESATNQTEPKAPLPEELVSPANRTEPKPKIVTLKLPITSTVELLYTLPLDGDKLSVARQKIDDLNELERQTNRRESALNNLESYVIEANQKLDENDYKSCATEFEIEAVRKACADVSDWLYEDGETADAETYEKRLLELKKLTNEIYARHWEHSERPEAKKTLQSLLDSAREFHKNARNFTKEVNPEKDVYTPVELETLDKTIVETEEWLLAEVAAQTKLKRHDTVRLTVKSLTDKMTLVDREVKYLVNKLKIWKPKVKKAKKEPKVRKNGTDETDGVDAKSDDVRTTDEQLNTDKVMEQLDELLKEAAANAADTATHLEADPEVEAEAEEIEEIDMGDDLKPNESDKHIEL